MGSHNMRGLPIVASHIIGTCGSRARDPIGGEHFLGHASEHRAQTLWHPTMGGPLISDFLIGMDGFVVKRADREVGDPGSAGYGQRL